MMASLGMFVFELPTLAYQELQRRTSWRFGANDRLGARAAQQFMGPGDDTISLSGVAFAELMNGSADLGTLREMGDQGEAVPLVDGAGRVYGNFIITTIDERQARFFPDGTPRQIDFGIDLLAVDQERSA